MLPQQSQYPSEHGSITFERAAKVLFVHGHTNIMNLCIHIPHDAEYRDEMVQIYTQAAFDHNRKLVENPTHIDAGFDLYYKPPPADIDTSMQCVMLNSHSHRGGRYIMKFPVKCAAQMAYIKLLEYGVCISNMYNTGYYVYPRSSLSDTPLRLANSVGIIDAGYRGNIAFRFDVVHDSVLTANPGRYMQICAPQLCPIYVSIVDSEEQLGHTWRGSGGFGSTGSGIDNTPMSS